MDFQEKLQLCWQNYKKWKAMALEEEDKEKSARFMQKAFFWLELQCAYTFLWAVEQTKKDAETKRKLLAAKVNLNKKLTDYARKILDELKL